MWTLAGCSGAASARAPTPERPAPAEPAREAADAPETARAAAAPELTEAQRSDTAALGGLAAARYQLRVGACPPGTLLQSVHGDGTPVCLPAGVTAYGESHGAPITPDANHAVAHLTVHAPAGGFLVVTAAFQVEVDNTDAEGKAVDCRAASQLGVTAALPAAGPGLMTHSFAASPPARGAGGALPMQPGWSVIRVPVLEAGDVTVYLRGGSDCAAARWHNVAMAATWEPGDATVAFGVH